MIEQAFKFDDVISMLDKSPCRVVFLKLDGTEREMLGTRRADLIPPAINSSTTERKENGELVRLYDLEKEGWRSFLMTNLIEITNE